MRRLMAIGIAAAVMGALALGALAAGKPADIDPGPRTGRPNVILIIADDLGYGDLSSYGGKVPTPNIDALARRGVRFTQAYSTHPVCAPSRAAMLTGRYQQRFGYEFNITSKGGADGLDPRETTVAQMLRDDGYATGLVGKWHLGAKPGYYPTDRGFGYFFGFTGGATTFIIDPKPGDEFHAAPSEDEIFSSSPALKPLLLPHPTAKDLETVRGFLPMSRNGQTVRVADYLTDALTDDAVGFIERNKSGPFFLVLAHGAVHVPFQATRKYLERAGPIADKSKRIYAAMTIALDDSVGAVMAKLRAEGLDRNTLVIFVSDNGCPIYVEDDCSNGRLSGYKETHFEGGIRVPFMVSWPGHIAPGRVDGRTVSSLDILPTILSATGASRPTDRAYDGVDLKPYLTTDLRTTPNPRLYWRAGDTLAVRDGAHKLISANEVTAAEVERAATRPYFISPDAPWTTAATSQHLMLYDLSRDIGESRNLAARDPKRAARLLGEARAWSKTLGAPQTGPSRVFHYRHDGAWLELYE